METTAPSRHRPHPTRLRRATFSRKREKEWCGGLLRCTGALIVAAAFPLPTRADPLPTIVTYELSKARHDAHALVRDPKGFWVGAIVARIEARKPDLDMHLKAPATVGVTFVVGRDGRLLSNSVSTSSGDPALDKRAVALLDQAAPFPPMPAVVPDDHVAFTVPLRFK